MAVPREEDRYREAVAASDAREARRGVRNAATSGPKTVKNPFPVTRRGDSAAPGRRDPRDAGGWRDVKKRREGEELDRMLAVAKEQEYLNDKQRDAIQQEQLRRYAIAQQEAEMGSAEGVQGSYESKVDYRIGVVAMFLLLATTIIADCLQFLLQFIPGVGQVIAWLITFIVGGFIFVCFNIVFRVPYFGGKLAPIKIGAVFIGSVVELVPILNALPTLTPTVLTLILASRAEDKLKASSPASKKPSFGGMKLGSQRITRR